MMLLRGAFMKNIKSILATSLILVVSGLTACGEEKEPPLPTFDPQEKVRQRGQGYAVDGTIAVDGSNNFFHMEHMVSSYYNIDTSLPAASLTPVKPSCSGTQAAATDSVHVIIARSGGRAKRLADIKQPSLMTFSNDKLEATAQERAQKYIETQTFKGIGQNYSGWSRIMSQKDIVITEGRKPVYVVLAGRYPTLYNFTVAPYAKVSGVLVYSDEPHAAVAGLDPSVPVHFQSAESPATKSCWVRTENKPDETWREHKKAMRMKPGSQASRTSRYHALKPIYNKFAAKVRKDAGSFTDSRLINVESGSYFLIGPAPTRLEQRIPYSPVSGSHIKFLENDEVQFGMRENLTNQAKNILHARTQKILEGAE